MILTLYLIMGLSYGLIIGFLSYCAVRPVWRLLPWYAKAILAPLAVFIVVDVVFNWTLAWLIFWQLPKGKKWTLTERCVALKTDTSWRGILAGNLCKNLNIFQPNHCH